MSKTAGLTEALANTDHLNHLAQSLASPGGETLLPPALILIGGVLLALALRGAWRSGFLCLLPLYAFYTITQLPLGEYLTFGFYGFEVTLLRVDALSKLFGYAFSFCALTGCLYAYHLRDTRQQVAALVYMGAALGAVFAGDLISFYVFWETMAIASTFLILARQSRAAYAAAFRYVLVHLAGGLVLLAGVVLHLNAGNTTFFTAMAAQTPATWCMLAGILVNAAVVPLHAWLTDAYPEATVTGGVVLSAFTTKTAIYALLRGFPGWEILIPLGCLMAVYAVVKGIMENDIRRVLAFAIINPLGFMLVGIGTGTDLGVNGAAAYAVCSIFYTSLLWMSAGSVVSMSGTAKLSELGGLARSMPATFVLAAVGALTISSMPLTMGFTTKNLILEAAALEHLGSAWLALKVASAGVFLLAGLRYVYFTFLGPVRGPQNGEVPLPSMHLAMGLMAAACVFLGVYPELLYHHLPRHMELHSLYTYGSVVKQLQLLAFTSLGFFLLLRLCERTEGSVLDTDWFWRFGGKLFYRVMDATLNSLNTLVDALVVKGLVPNLSAYVQNLDFKAVYLLTMPFWLLSGTQPQNLRFRKAELEKTFSSATLPVGISAAAAVVVVALLLAILLTGGHHH